MSCIFCSIASGEIPAPLLASNDQAVAFADRAPQAPVHILVVPRQHIVNFNDPAAGGATMLAGMAALVQQLALKYGNEVDNGFTIKINNGGSAGQEVFHMHWHFLARGPRLSA